MSLKLLKQLCEVPGASGSEAGMKAFLLAYIGRHSKKWKTQPEIIEGDEFQDCLMLKFGKPRTAIFAHMDTVGFTVRYFNQLVAIGSPDAETGTRLVGKDSLGMIDCELELDKDNHAFYKFGRSIDRGTALTYHVNFRERKDIVESAYLDNRLGMYCALQVAEKLKDGVVAFSCWEEHGGGSVGYLAKHMYKQWNVRQALIADITWATDGVELGKGCVISLRDRNVPRRAFVDKVVSLAKKSKQPFQLEVEGAGSSDGGELQRSPYPFDWCFVGAPEMNPHAPTETVHKHDIESMVNLYHYLMKAL